MKVNWLAATILMLLFSLVPLTTQASWSGQATQASELDPALERNSVSASCCDRCLACDAEDICSLLCAATAAVPRPATGIAVPRDRSFPWPRAAGWVPYADPPEPDPPRSAFVV